ncbi:methionine gamma-lyase family protein [Paenalkalicoccus suaedae]|uniref:Methionine gamma-lyase family protein n=1 Tax=Paenalkalicoccus suaedae TaxID=2592382 RepID=A0A859FDB5_9BACI|nr:methionine gamma-lyase family protein [Paenalkalicoccus suaedae]QKS71353.1 methionine gamma-lyase family protein [Paenalkalicoccus suaedae]
MSYLQELADTIHESQLTPFFKRSKIAEENQRRVLTAFREESVSEFHFQASTGYGYDDAGRETLERVYARVFGTEEAIVRTQLISGTHAIATALFGLLRPKEELLYVTGKPYDTLEEVIGIRGSERDGSLRDYGIAYREVDLVNGEIDVETVIQTITPKTKVIGIQRSKGYGDRPSLTISKIEKSIKEIKEAYPNVLVFVDNCYGEFVETREPTHVGADVMAGSLIKNPGGGIAKAGGYIVGSKEIIEACGARLSAPGIGLEGGATLGTLLDMFQGFFLAPHTVNEAVKGAIFTSAYLEALGMTTSPKADAERTDLIQSVSFKDKESMIAFCQAIQSFSPVDAHVLPSPAPMPGYEDDVIMAAGTFIQGASIELTADGPIRPPYTAYVQGGLTFEHIKVAVVGATMQLEQKGLL